MTRTYTGVFGTPVLRAVLPSTRRARTDGDQRERGGHNHAGLPALDEASVLIGSTPPRRGG